MYLIRGHALFNALSENEFILLFKILKLVSYSCLINQQYIKQIPIFATINNTLVSLASTSEVWIWNHEEICTAGMNQWINHISNSIIFLDPLAPWAQLKHEAENLQMSHINKYDVYYKFIFPNFHHLDSNAQLDHLEFINAEIFSDCKHILKTSKDSNTNHKVKEFVNALKSLRCIPDDTGTLRTIGSFYDHNNQIFQVFCDKSCFLLNTFRNQKWYDFFLYFGLKTVPTPEEFVQYCKGLSNLDSISTIRKGSGALLNVLLDISDTNVNKYKKIHSHQQLHQISQIPIVIVEKISHLDCIVEQKMGELKVNCSGSSVTLTKLCGSSLITNNYLVWTTLPLIKIPNDCYIFMEKFRTRIDHLGIMLSPSLKDVLANLTNLSTSKFAKFNRFEKCTTDSSTCSSSLLPTIVINMLDYIKMKLTESSIGMTFEGACKNLEPVLSDLNFLPVKLPIRNTEEYALVKPIQVLCMEQSEVLPYYPFLHPLIEEATGNITFLSKFGVKRSFSFIHVQTVLKSIKNLCQDNEVDLNSKRIISKITQELIKLLQRTAKKSDIVQSLKPLYLLSQTNVLTECSRLIVCDITSSCYFPLPAGYSYLNLLKDSEQPDIKELPYLLPDELGLKSLRSIISYELINSTPAENVFPNISKIKDIILSSEFKKAIEYFSRCCNNGVISERVSSILTKFQSTLTIQCLNSVQVKPNIKIDDDFFPLDVVMEHCFFFHKSLNQRWVLSLKNTHDHYPHAVFVKLAKRLCSNLRLKSTKCFEVTDDDELPELTGFICDILQCNSISKVVELIKTHLPGVDIMDLEANISVNRDPVLGDSIPKRFHHTLIQDIFYFFYPEEWVGYENENGTIVYVQILDEVDQEENATVEEPLQLMMIRKYIITIGMNATNVEVSALQLYKFIYNQSIEQSSSSGDVDMYDGSSTSEPTAGFLFTNIIKARKLVKKKTDKKTIRTAVKVAWTLPEQERNKAIKRLYLQYHPDKNPDNPNATIDFQYLLQEIERMEQGMSEDEADGKGMTSNHSRTSSSGYHGQFNQWNQTASSHRYYRSRDNETSPEDRTPGAWNIPRSHPNLDEAKRWIGQAEYDYSALCVLTDASKTKSKVAAAACFMCHEVAEKSLKAGMYAKHGIGEATLNHHNIVFLAKTLVNLNCPVSIQDAKFLERFYLDTRFPNRYPPPTIPGEKFLSDTSVQAFDAATRIYDAMKQLIEE